MEGARSDECHLFLQRMMLTERGMALQGDSALYDANEDMDESL